MAAPELSNNEPFYLYRRKLNEYFMQRNKPLIIDAITLINLLFNTEYKHLSDIKKIKTLPTINHIETVIKNNGDLCNRLNFKGDIDVYVSLNKILNKLGFALVKCGYMFTIKIIANSP